MKGDILDILPFGSFYPALDCIALLILPHDPRFSKRNADKLNRCWSYRASLNLTRARTPSLDIGHKDTREVWQPRNSNAGNIC